MKALIVASAVTLLASPVLATPKPLIGGSESSSDSSAVSVGINKNTLEADLRNINQSSNRNTNQSSNRNTNSNDSQATSRSNQGQTQGQTMTSTVTAPTSQLSTNSVNITESAEYVFPVLSLPNVAPASVGSVSCPSAALGASIFGQGQDGFGANYGGMISFVQPLGTATCNAAQKTEKEILEAHLEMLRLELSILKQAQGLL